MLAPGLCFLRPEHPADPLIAGTRGASPLRSLRRRDWAGSAVERKPAQPARPEGCPSGRTTASSA